VIFLGDFSFVKIFLKNYCVTMTTTLNTSRSENHNGFVGEGFCMHVFSSKGNNVECNAECRCGTTKKPCQNRVSLFKNLHYYNLIFFIRKF
jgi:hypothetical protein